MPAYCSFCGAELSPWAYSDDDCSACYQEFRNDVDKGNIPAGLPKEAYKFWLWKAIRQKERDVNAGRISETDARADVARMVGNAKKDYEKIVFMETEKRREAAALEDERHGSTGFLV